MNAIVINRQLSKIEISNISAKLSGEGSDYHLFSNAVLDKELEKYSKGRKEIFPEEKRKINYDIFQQVLKFGDRKINGKAIADILCMDRTNLWHYHKFRIYFQLRNFCFDVALLKNMLRDYDQIAFYTDNTLLHKNNPDSSRIFLVTGGTPKARINYTSLFYYFLFFTVRVILSFIQIGSVKKKKHIVVDHTKKQVCLNINSLKEERANYILSNLINRLDNRFLVLDDVEIPKLDSRYRFRIIPEHFKGWSERLFGEYIMFRGFISVKIKRTRKLYLAALNDFYTEAENSSLDHTERNILSLFKSYHKTTGLYLQKYLSYKHFFERYAFLSISSIDENSPRIKTILDAAKFSGIVTVGIQHGTIHELHPAYMYTIEDIDRKIVPDYNLLWGKYWKSLLKDKGNYPPESLVIIGQIRTDIIPEITRTKVPLSALSRIKKDKKIILYASQFQRDLVLREKAALDIMKAVSNNDNLHLIVKLHPSEKNEFEYYHNLASEANCKNYNIIYSADLYLLLSRSDVVVTCFSTVGAEAVYFKKPLVIIDYLKQDIQNYYKSGIALQATSLIELQNYLDSIITGKIDLNRSAYDKFIDDYAFRIDGKVCERYYDFIEKLNH